MAIITTERFPCGNARILEIKQNEPEIIFTPEPRGNGEALWFYFKMHSSRPAADAPAPAAAPEVRLTLLFFSTLFGAEDPALCRPVFRVAGKNWERLRPPQVTQEGDGSARLSWTLPFPTAETEIAFSPPYANRDLVSTLEHCHGYWKRAGIGLTAGGQILERLSNGVANGQPSCPNPHGLYVLARRNAGEMPGSWALDGLLEAFSRTKPVNWCVRAVPFANLDGSIAGAFGRDPSASRREDTLIRKDLARWAKQCKPELVLDLGAAGATVSDNVHGLATPGDEKMGKALGAWCNVLANALQPDYAGADFAHPPTEPDALRDWVHSALGCPFVPVEIPYAAIRGQPLMQKQYREIGRCLAKAVLTRW